MQGDDHRGGGRVMNLSESDKRYISEQIRRYQDAIEQLKLFRSGLTFTIASNKRQDALWRIASRTKLFEDLSPTGVLTDDQWNRTIDFIEQFQSNNN